MKHGSQTIELPLEDKSYRAFTHILSSQKINNNWSRLTFSKNELET